MLWTYKQYAYRNDEITRHSHPVETVRRPRAATIPTYVQRYTHVDINKSSSSSSSSTSPTIDDFNNMNWVEKTCWKHLFSQLCTCIWTDQHHWRKSVALYALGSICLTVSEKRAKERRNFRLAFKPTFKSGGCSPVMDTSIINMVLFSLHTWPVGAQTCASQPIFYSFCWPDASGILFCIFCN